ncbi:MAG: phytanoyl-CoA dioxygenase family protein [Candidatus Synoicihabitans palmerolidicus]|nr:phytanoyl-CoA dioxygenase family protein [Candidatus Synoicihabitans palmerolidicus]
MLEATRAAAEALLWEKVEADPLDESTWYGPTRTGITIDIFQHPVLTALRRSSRIHKAFAQLSGTADLWTSADRMSFNLPETVLHPYAGQGMHWDVNLARPIPFGTQGILYLTDTPPEQGAFALVPEFNRKIDAWLDSLPEDESPGQQDLPALGPEPVGGKAGDLSIWNHLLPHGPTPNRGEQPRMVFYLNMYPASYRAQAEWL